MQLNYIVREFVTRFGSNAQILDLNDKVGVIKIMNVPGSVGSYIVIIANYDPVYEISVMSDTGKFTKEDDIPQFLALMLLRENAKKKMGFWCVEEIPQMGFAVSQMHNIAFSDCTVETFGLAIMNMLESCISFDERVINVLKQTGNQL